MKRIYLLIVTLNLVVTGALVVYLLRLDSKKIVFIYSQKVFQQYEGTKYLMQKLSLQHAAEKKDLDSLAELIENGRADLKMTYESRLENYNFLQRQLSEQYTADIWKRINAGISEYGKQNSIDYVLGASGNGSLMYAPESDNVTDDVVKYLNVKYDGN